MRMPLPLPKDVHAPVAPDWWPPAPGWWVLMALLVIAVVLLIAWRLIRKRRQDQILRLFDDALAAGAPSEQVAAMSQLLRRAARRAKPDADRLEGAEWLSFLDQGMPDPVFTAGAGRLLQDGGFRDDVSEAEVDALRAIARRRYLVWMRGA